MEYGITFPRMGIAEHPSPWKYLTHFAREAERMGCAYGVIGGVGTGSLFRDYEVVGMDHHDMWPRFEEGVRAMRAYLSPGTPPFKGRFYDTNGVNLEPAPVQTPSLPIWIGSWGSNA